MKFLRISPSRAEAVLDSLLLISYTVFASTPPLCSHQYYSTYSIFKNICWFTSVCPQLYRVIQKQELCIIHSLLLMVHGT